MPNRSASRITITVAFGYVDADLDDGRGHQHVELAGPKGVHHRFLVGGRHPSVEQTDTESDELPSA